MTLNLSSCATRTVAGISIRNPNELSSVNASIPTLIQFNRSKHLSLNVKAQYSTPQDQQYQKQRFSSYDSSSPSPPAQSPPRVYVAYSIYKGKAALQVEPRSPEFCPLDSGAFKLSKEGFVLFQFAPAAGVRQYD